MTSFLRLLLKRTSDTFHNHITISLFKPYSQLREVTVYEISKAVKMLYLEKFHIL